MWLFAYVYTNLIKELFEEIQVKYQLNATVEIYVSYFTFHVDFECTAVIDIARLVSCHIINKNFSNIEMCSWIFIVFNNWCFVWIVQELGDVPQDSFWCLCRYDQLVFRTWCIVWRFIIYWTSAMLETNSSMVWKKAFIYTLRCEGLIVD